MNILSQRIRFVDLLRGVAVAIMVMGHCIDAVLSPAARESEVFRLYDFARGFTAPVFLFVSGLAFMIATRRYWADYTTASRRLLKRFARVALLLVLGYALHLPYFSMTKILTASTPEDLAQLYQVNILQCIAVTILITQLIILVGKTPHRVAWLAAGLGTAIVLVTPFISQIDFGALFSRALAPYLNQVHPSIFPLFPYAAFMVAGTVVAHLFLGMRDHEHEAFSRLVFLGCIVAGLVGVGAELAPWSLFPPHDYWKASPNFFLVRLSFVLLLTGTFFLLRNMPDATGRHLEAMGKASLLIYVVHMLIAFGSAANKGLAQLVGRELSGLQAVACAATVLACMLLLAHAWGFLRRNHFLPARLIQVGVASTLMYLFLTRPH